MIPDGSGPLIIDTDIGGDPDDAVAVVAAARTVPDLALVITNDETTDASDETTDASDETNDASDETNDETGRGNGAAGLRARLARHLLDLCGRSDVPVVAGAALPGGTGYFCCAGIGSPAALPGDVVAAVSAVARRPGPVRWLGIGAMTNLAAVLQARPELAARLDVTQMGGALRHRDPTRADHNVGLDPAAAARVLSAVPRLRFVTSEVTFRPEIEVGSDSPLYRSLAKPGAGPWAAVVRANFDCWFAGFHPTSMQHDALALAAALGVGVVAFDRVRVGFDAVGRMSRRSDGVAAEISVGADYVAFIDWLHRALDLPGLAVSPALVAPAASRTIGSGRSEPTNTGTVR
ncbi:MAG TPA: nucleoside hydrolase [Pilimelia sp.]|nr:nucleoside hydrolase [Pilimelia sp.]